VTSARTGADIGDERKRVLSPSARDICGAVNVPHESEAMRAGALIGQPQLVFLRVDVRLCAPSLPSAWRKFRFSRQHAVSHSGEK